MKNVLFIATMVTLLFTACSRNQQEPLAQEDQGPEPLVYTLYSGNTELFVEFDPLVVGQTAKFATHLTVLGETFTPMTEGAVTLILSTGSTAIKTNADGPQVPGIYRLALKPQTAGKATLTFTIRTKEFNDQFVIKGLTVYTDEKSALAHSPHSHGDEAVTYLKEQAWKSEFANAAAVKLPVSHVIRATGEVLSAAGDEFIVTATSDGVVMLSDADMVPGSVVQKGAKLFTVVSGGHTGRNVEVAFQEAKSRYEKAKADYERLSELVKDKIVSEKEYLAAKAEFENARSAYTALSRNYQSGGQTIPAPAAGYIKSITVSNGQFVSAGAPLAVISKSKRLMLRAEVSQKYFQQLSSVQGANFRTSASGETYSTEELHGKLIGYGKSAVVETPFIPVTFDIDNPGTIIPGSHAEVFLKTAPGDSVLAIPISSLLEEQGSFFVYVQTGGESFQKREVHTGKSDGIFIEITDGIKPGERVVTKGAFQIKLATASGALPAHGHEH